MFSSILDTAAGTLSVTDAFICLGGALILGFIISGAYMMCGAYTKSFAVTLTLLPVIVQVVIMLVNGNLGAGVAVLGAFSLVRFRSVPGSAREICAIFLAMAAGLATGMGYIAFAAVVVVAVCVVFVLLSKTSFGEQAGRGRELKITIPETLDYTEVFDDIFQKYAQEVALIKAKTVNLGSMFELKYEIKFKPDVNEKQFIDEIRCRNGNLTVACGRIQTHKDEL